jgi:hypothetical protein
MNVTAGCGVYRQPITATGPMPVYLSSVERERSKEQGQRDANKEMRTIPGLLKYFPSVGWVSVYKRKAGYFAFIDGRQRYTARPAQSIEELDLLMQFGPTTDARPWKDPASSRRKEVMI